MYTDNNKKLFAITNPRFPASIRQNAVIHAVVGLMQQIDLSELELLPYENEALSIRAKISLYPNIGLSSKNGNQLLKTYQTAQSSNILCNIFTESMLGGSAEEQQTQTSEAVAETIGPIALVLFGDTENLRPLTKKFSVLKD